MVAVNSMLMSVFDIDHTHYRNTSMPKYLSSPDSLRILSWIHKRASVSVTKLQDSLAKYYAIKNGWVMAIWEQFEEEGKAGKRR